MTTAVHRVTVPRAYVIVSFAGGLGLLWLAIRGADWPRMLGTAQRAQPGYLGAAFLILTGSYFVRGLRWRVLLSPVKTVEPLIVFWATMVGYLGNNFLPARAGELIRTVYLGRHTRIGKSYILATALTERVMDLLFLLILGLGAAIWERNTPRWILDSAVVVGAVGILGAGAVAVAPRFDKEIVNLIGYLPIPNPLKPRASGLLERFLLGLEPLHDVRRTLGFITLTAVIWLTDAVAALAVARSFDFPLTLPLVILLLTALGLASAVPSTPGSVGIFQFVTVSILSPFGISRDDSLVYIFAFQAVIYATVVIWGGAGAWQLTRSVDQA